MIGDRDNQHFLSCVAAVSAGVVVPAFWPEGSIVGAGAAAAGGLAGNLLANWLKEYFDQRQNDPSLPDRNHDLLRAVANAVAHEIAEYERANTATLGDQGHGIQVMARRAASDFASLFEANELPGIESPDVLRLLESSARGETMPPAGKLADWETIVSRLAQIAVVQLAPQLQADLAKTLHERLWESIRKALKNDFAADGKAYAALHLQFMGEMMARFDELMQACRSAPLATQLSQQLIEELRHHKETEAEPRGRRIKQTIAQLPAAERARLASLIQRYDQLSTRLDRNFRQLLEEIRAGDHASAARDRSTHRRLAWVLGCIAIMAGIFAVGFFQVRSTQNELIAHASKAKQARTAEALDSERLNRGSASFSPPASSQSTAPRTLVATRDKPFVNSLGMRFVPVPGTTVLFSIWETRVCDFAQFVSASGYNAEHGMFSMDIDGWKQRGATWRNPGVGFEQTDNHPVVGVNQMDAKAFCVWLTARERETGHLTATQCYRLPKDLEWSCAIGIPGEMGETPFARIRDDNVYPWGHSFPPPASAGNYAGRESKIGREPVDWKGVDEVSDGYPRTSPVGSFRVNNFGLFDLGGNAWEWCEDAYEHGDFRRVMRGGSWENMNPMNMLSSFRLGAPPSTRTGFGGFRCVLAAEETSR